MTCLFLCLRLDNTWVVEVNSSLLCNGMSENGDLYIKLYIKLGIFSSV